MNFSIPKDYSEFTGLRHCNNSDNSGEDFYHKKLNECFASAYNAGEELYLYMDGSKGGYTPSFIDEAIGNLIFDFGLDTVKNKLKIVSSQKAQWDYILENRTYPDWTMRIANNDSPKKTESHPAWFKLVNGNLEKRIWINVTDVK